MILLTGASGFLGKHIFLELKQSEKIITLGRHECDLNYDLSFEIPANLPAFTTVIHAAGKAHLIPKTTQQKQEFYNVNVIGTQNLLKGLKQASSLPKTFIFISSVSVYGKETGQLIDENVSLLATDSYGKSKIQAEIIVKQWCNMNSVTCTILRLPLLAGPNPPGNLAAMIKSIKTGYYFNIGGGKAKKSIVLAADVAKIILGAAAIGGIYNLTDAYHPNFAELSEIIAKQSGKSHPLNIPIWLAKLMAKVGDLVGTKAPINSNRLIKITSDLTFDDSKAQKILGWNPTPVLKGFKIK